MRYLLAILLPPVAVLLCGKPIQALLNLGLTLLFWVPGVVHALVVVANADADRRNARLVREVRAVGVATRTASMPMLATPAPVSDAPTAAALRWVGPEGEAVRLQRAAYFRSIGACPWCGWKKIAGKAACPMCKRTLEEVRPGVV